MDGRLAAALIILASVMFGFMGLNTKVLAEYGLLPESVAFLRLLITVVLLAAIMLFVDRGSFRIRTEHLMLFLLIGFCKVMMDYTLIASQKHMTLGFSTALQMTAPFFVIVLAYIIYRQKVTSAGVIGTVVCIAGTVLYSGIISDNAHINAIGIFDGVLCGISTAGFLMLTKNLLSKGYSPMTIILYSFIIALLFLLPHVDVPQSLRVASDGVALVNMILLGVFCTAIPFVLTAYAQGYVDTLRASICSSFEIVAAAAVGWAFFGESLDFSGTLGIILIIAATVIITKGEGLGSSRRHP